jgi:hypothetical protein
VVFEVLSPNNTEEEMAEKLVFYERFGVEEYYMLDPDLPALEVYLRRQGQLHREAGEEHVSPRLGIRFLCQDNVLSVFHPNGRRFQSFVEVRAERKALAQRVTRMKERLRALGIDPDEV